MDIKTGYFLADGNAVNVDLGFVPDFLILLQDVAGGTNELVAFWSNALYADGITSKWGLGSIGNAAWAALASANAGVIPYNTDGIYANILSPIPEKGKLPQTINEYVTSGTYVARTGTVTGSIVIPSTRNGYVYECTTWSSADGTPEPTWPTTPGETVTEGTSTNVFTCRELEIVRGGGKGFTMGSTLSANGEYTAFLAFRADKSRYLGDAADGDLKIV